MVTDLVDWKPSLTVGEWQINKGKMVSTFKPETGHRWEKGLEKEMRDGEGGRG